VLSILPHRIVNDCPFHCDPKHPACPQCAAPGNKPKTTTLTGERAFVRVQGSPDLTAEDLIGDIDPIKALKYGPLAPESFTPGKIFKANKGILFFDEVNRASEKLQNALLQVLEEKRVTIGSYDVDVDADFLFIGTMNPEDTSTEKLSDVFLDRFDLLTVGYPETGSMEHEIVTRRRTAIHGIAMPEKLQQQVITFIRQLRTDKNIDRKPGVRASIGVVDRSSATARLRGHHTVTVEDVASVIGSVVGHRMSLKPSIKYLEQPESYIQKQFTTFVRDHNMDGGEA
jgi:Mg-chelatase subunit ChlI